MTDFDRVRTRRLDDVPDGNGDPHGKRALFTDPPQHPAPPFPAMSIDCSTCGDESLVSLRDALGLAVPSVHLPFVRRDHESWMRCPACGERTWVRLRVRL